jgi:hypothetical protein
MKPCITEMRILLTAAEQGPNVIFCMPNGTNRILFMVVKQGPNVLFCMPNRIECIVLVSVMMASQINGIICSCRWREGRTISRERESIDGRTDG